MSALLVAGQVVGGLLVFGLFALSIWAATPDSRDDA